MKNESVRMKGTVCALALACVLTAFVPFCLFSDEVDADGAVEPDYTFYRYTIKFFSTSQDAKYLVWDFADGTVLDGRWEYYIQLQNDGEELSAEILAGIDAYRELLIENGNSIYCPIHTYSAPGVYTYSITAYNPVGFVGEGGMPYDGVFSTDDAGYDGGLFSDSEDSAVIGSKDTAYITLDVRGFPTITLNNNGTTSQMVVENTDVYSKATEPAAPVREGHEFTGWYTDAACTQAYDWNSIVEHDITLYAGWNGGTTPIVPEPENVSITVNGTQLTVDEGMKVSDLPVDDRDGFEFAGWYSDITFAHKVAGTTVLTDGMTLFAKYNAIQETPGDDEPKDEPSDDPSDEPVPGAVEDKESAILDYLPYIVCVAGAILLLIGYRNYNNIILVLGTILIAVGAVDIAGILEVF